MDNILEKHLAAALLLPKENLLSIPEISENIIPYYSYKSVGNSNYIRLSSGLLRTETIGYWKNKPVFLYRDEEYVLLENSKTIVRTETLKITKEQITEEKEDKKVDEIESYLKSTKKEDKPVLSTEKQKEDEEENEEENESENDIIHSYIIGNRKDKTTKEIDKTPEKEINTNVELPQEDDITPIPTNQHSSIIGSYLKNLN